ncbi:paraquat-inducible protein A [Frigidibacter oleivorans]|uniref:paraquat-inducible protein A n=1 Tax=Frigidibacter oleivorans TaxID=2487129 RepID=UPI000F8CC6CA|nr:paraquat-inducible protein A [Frigidibacter oleivorans]
MTARQAGLVACTRCGRVWPADVHTCARCGAPLSSRDPGALQRVWAWWIAGLVVYIPANVYPMLITRTLNYSSEATILGGVIELLSHGDVLVALVVFVASILIPVGKFIAIGFLALSVEKRRWMSEHGQHRLHAVVEFIGRWSMIDVFVVAILASLVRFDAVATINPGIAAVSFALSVAFTMLAAQSFDPRTIWDD